jgi:hypothetical protein
MKLVERCFELSQLPSELRHTVTVGKGGAPVVQFFDYRS